MLFPHNTHFVLYLLQQMFASLFVCSFWHNTPHWAKFSSLITFLYHTQRLTTVDITPLDGWSARRRDLYLTTHNSHYTQTSLHPAGFQPTISAGERPQAYGLDRAATGTGLQHVQHRINRIIYSLLQVVHYLSPSFSIYFRPWLRRSWRCLVAVNFKHSNSTRFLIFPDFLFLTLQ